MRVNDRSGRTRAFPLDTPDGAGAWAEVETDPCEQQSIRGVILGGPGSAQIAITRPRRFRSVAYQAESCPNGATVLGERLVIQADDVRLTVLVYRSGMARVDLEHTGQPRHLAQFRRRNNRGRP